MIKHLFIWTIAAILLAACQNPADTTTAKDSVTNHSSSDTVSKSVDSVKTVALNDGTHCFAYTKNHDTVYMQLTLQDSSVSGKLLYNFYEKDKNKGTFKGRLRNDTLLADYNFSSEGMRSIRQVVFLVRGNILLSGSGSMKEQSGKMVFSNRSDIIFDSNMVMEPTNCDKISFK